MALIARQVAALRRQVLETLRHHALCAPGDTLIVAVSGGADSVALLDLLATLPDLPLSLVVAHLNHCLRGGESDGDERFVAELAAARGFPFETCRVDVRALAAEQGRSLEEAGRDARYAFFDRLRQQYAAAAVATAHHADDQAETFLLRLLRGAGGSGLGCMPFRNDRAVIRPLLEVSRRDLLRYLHERGLAWREDSSNLDTTLLRNRVRHELLPLLETYNPSVMKRLASTAYLLRQDEELLARQVETVFAELVLSDGSGLVFDAASCGCQPEGLRFRLYRRALELLTRDLRCFDSTHIRQLDRLLLHGGTGARLPLPRGLVAIRTADGLVLSRADAALASPPRATEITGPARYDLGNGLSLLVELAAVAPTSSAADDSTALVDLDAAPFPWQVRPHARDDRLSLPGGEGSRSVGRLMIDRKVPRHLRPLLPLLLSADQPLWLAGVRRSGHARVTERTGTIARITVVGLCLRPAAGIRSHRRDGPAEAPSKLL